MIEAYRGRFEKRTEDTPAGPMESDHAVVRRPDGTELSLERSRKLRHHSPTGFSWGYHGGGPAQLALALLLDAGVPRGPCACPVPDLQGRDREPLGLDSRRQVVDVAGRGSQGMGSRREGSAGCGIGPLSPFKPKGASRYPLSPPTARQGRSRSQRMIARGQMGSPETRR